MSSGGSGSKPKLLSLADLPGRETGARFEGRDHGASVSFFVSHHRRGTGAPPHRHPYEETFIVHEGSATFTIDGEEIEVHGGQVVIVPAGAVHAFVSSGAEVLRHVSIHPADHMVSELVEE